MAVKNDYNINSLIKSIKVFEYLLENNEMSILELSNLSSIGKSTIHRILGTFKAMGYVDQNKENNKYYATLKIFELGNKVANRIPLRKIVRPYIEQLYEKCHETVNFAIIDKNEMVFLDKIVTEEPLRIELEIGRRAPAYCSALGKAILAFKSDADVSSFSFKKITRNTIDSQYKFKKELEDIREKGYAIDNEEYIEGLVCLAVPIKDQLNKSIGAISIATPVVRLSEEKKQLFINMLQETVSRIMNHINY